MIRNSILLEPYGGLVNRMRVIVSGLWLADLLNKKIILIWNINPELNCPFEEIFEPINNIKILNKKKNIFLIRSTTHKSLLLKLIVLFINKLVKKNYICFEDEKVKSIQNGDINIMKLGKSNKALYFNTCEEFGDNFNEYRKFIPKPGIQQRINETCNHFNQKTIGVHIRRTDHEIALQYSPDELFIERMKRDLEKDPEINYFLTTDNPKTEALFKSIFGNKILMLEKEYSRNSPHGIKDAVVDFYCLSNTPKIYGSHTSSFSYIAARIKGSQLEIIQINKTSV